MAKMAGHLLELLHLQDLTPYIDQHGYAHSQKAARPPPDVAEQSVPQPYNIRERELLCQQKRDPAERIELWIHLTPLHRNLCMKAEQVRRRTVC